MCQSLGFGTGNMLKAEGHRNYPRGGGLSYKNVGGGGACRILISYPDLTRACTGLKCDRGRSGYEISRTF